MVTTKQKNKKQEISSSTEHANNNSKSNSDYNESDISVSMTRLLLDMFQKDGVSGLYKGCRLQLIHTLLKSALLMMVRERITVITRKMLLGK